MKQFFIGDILNLTFCQELFWVEGKSVATEDLIMYMLGIDDEEYEDRFENDFLASILTELCIASLHHQYDFLSSQRFRESSRGLLRKLKRCGDNDDCEMDWIMKQAQLYGEMLPVSSISFLFIPRNQERFSWVRGMEVFSDRPLNMN